MKNKLLLLLGVTQAIKLPDYWDGGNTWSSTARDPYC